MDGRGGRSTNSTARGGARAADQQGEGSSSCDDHGDDGQGNGGRPGAAHEDGDDSRGEYSLRGRGGVWGGDDVDQPVPRGKAGSRGTREGGGFDGAGERNGIGASGGDGDGSVVGFGCGAASPGLLDDGDRGAGQNQAPSSTSVGGSERMLRGGDEPRATNGGLGGNERGGGAGGDVDGVAGSGGGGDGSTKAGSAASARQEGGRRKKGGKGVGGGGAGSRRKRGDAFAAHAASASRVGGVDTNELRALEAELEKRSGEGGWDPRASACWAPRALWCDAKALTDTEAVERQRFESDWQRVRSDLGVERVVMRADDDGAADADGNGIADEVEDVQGVLWQFHVCYAVVFDFYAAVGASGGSADVSFLSLNMWTQFIMDFDLVSNRSKFCKQSDLDTLFISIDSLAGRVHAERLKEEGAAKQSHKGPQGGGAAVTARFDDKRQKLSRVEFMAALVQIAIKRFVDTKAMDDVSEALARFLSEDILAKLKSTHAPPNDFRLRHLYTREVDEVIGPRLGSLRAVFEALVGRGKLRRLKLLSLIEWLAFLRAANITGADVSERDAALCFVWSRMYVANDRTENGTLRQEALPFEGFLEALCRVSTLKALPTDAELDAAKLSHNAGSYLADLKLNHVDKYNSLMKRARPWGSEPPPHLPVHRCVEHLCSILIHAVDQAGDGEISAAEVGNWIREALQKEQERGA
jgi:hypothetical protein